MQSQVTPTPPPPRVLSESSRGLIRQLICGHVTKWGLFVLKAFSQTGSRKTCENNRVGFKDEEVEIGTLRTGGRGREKQGDQEKTGMVRATSPGEAAEKAAGVG